MNRLICASDLQVMERTGADYTNTFHWMSSIPMPTLNNPDACTSAVGEHPGEKPDGGFLRRMLESLPTPQSLAATIAPQMSLEVCCPTWDGQSVSANALSSCD